MSATPLRLTLLVFVYFGAVVALFFGSAGRWDLPFAWATLGIYGAFAMAMPRIMDPELLKERLRPGAGGKDRHLRWLALPFVLAFWIVAGFDIRRGWSPPVPAGLHLAGLAGLTGSLAVVGWAMATNRFFSPVVRIQAERGHHLIDCGPYRYVRHPGYAGSLAATFCAAPALGSWWALAPSAVMMVMLLRRAALEDAFLQRELSGYPAYAQQVRWRLLPGIW